MRTRFNYNKPSSLTLPSHTEGQQQGNDMAMGVLLGQLWQGLCDQMSFLCTLLEPFIAGLDAVEWKERKGYIAISSNWSDSNMVLVQ